MTKKRALILGAGISGLSFAWYFSQAHPDWEVVILEKEATAGGCIRSVSKGFFFEQGPRTFKASKNPALLSLIQDLSLTEDLIVAGSKAKKKYIWCEGKLHRVPQNLKEIFSSPLTQGIISALLTEWKQPVCDADESVYQFISRRLGESLALRIFDPLLVGIYGGDIKQLSANTCLPMLKKWERQGSLTRGFFSHKRAQEPLPIPAASLFTLKQGMGHLIETLLCKMPAKVEYRFEVEKVRFLKEGVEVRGKDCAIEGDHLYCALPFKKMQALLSPPCTVEAQDVTVVNLGYQKEVLPLEGFGYLVPSWEKEEIMGVCFDSHSFPMQNRSALETRLSVIIKGVADAEEIYSQKALEGIKRHLGLREVPDLVIVKKYPEAIPQFEVAHSEKIERLQKWAQGFPHLTLLGNYFEGASVNHCISYSRKRVF